MASALQETLSRIINKSNVLIEKYHALSAEKEELAARNAQLEQEVAQLKQQLEKLQQSLDYLSMARSIAPDAQKAAQTRALITSLVRDIDKCIAQLNE